MRKSLSRPLFRNGLYHILPFYTHTWLPGSGSTRQSGVSVWVCISYSVATGFAITGKSLGAVSTWTFHQLQLVYVRAVFVIFLLSYGGARFQGGSINGWDEMGWDGYNNLVLLFRSHGSNQ
jgi:hypothetical protein